MLFDIARSLKGKNTIIMTKQVESITVIAGNYPAPGHPALVFVQQLVHAMIEQGIKVSVIAYQSVIHALVHGERLLPRHSKGLTDRGEEYDIYRPYTLSFGNRNLFPRLAKWFNRQAILSMVKRVNSDVLYAHFWSSALPVYKFAKANKLPLFVACGEGDDALEQMVEAMPKEQQKELAMAVTGVVSVSSENKRKCIKFGLSTESNTSVFPNCVNTNLFYKLDVPELKQKLGIKKTDFVICFVGSFTNRKGPDRVAQAIKKLNDPNIKVMFIGKPFKGYNSDFDCPGIIHKGTLDHELLPMYINCADVFVLPTLKEGCCNAIVEALAIGLPVISSEGPFNDDILDEKNSIRIDPCDIEAIAGAIGKLRDDIALRQSMSEYSLAHDYSIVGRAKRILTFMNKRIENLFII